MSNFKNASSSFATAARDWLKHNVDFAFILAAVTEVPRWAVTFTAIHEPGYIGVPLGLLLAFATARAWKSYFITRSRAALFFNIVALAIAIVVISPVLLALAMTPANDAEGVNLAKILTVPQLAVWAVLLGMTTFAPLIQLAATEGVLDRLIHPAEAKSEPVVTKSEPAVTILPPIETPALPAATPVEPKQLPVETFETPTDIVVSPIASTQLLLNVLTESPSGVTATALLQLSGLSRDTFKPALTALVEQKRVRVQGQLIVLVSQKA